MSVLRIRASILFPLLLGTACGGAGRAHAAGHGRVIDVDDFGDTLRAPARPPQRIVSLNPTTTEIVFAIGAGPRLVGRSQWGSWPDSALRVPALGPAVQPNVEAVLAVHPDLVLLYASAADQPAAARFRDAGIPIAALRIDRIAEFRRATRDLGMLLGDSARAATVVDSVDRTLDGVRRATRHLSRPAVLVVTWENPVIVIGGGSFMSELIDIAGGRNVYGDLPAPSPTVSLEDVVARAPDIVLASPEGRARILADPLWQAVPAVRRGRVVAYDTTVVGRPSVVLGEAAVSLARVLHPGLRP